MSRVDVSKYIGVVLEIGIDGNDFEVCCMLNGVSIIMVIKYVWINFIMGFFVEYNLCFNFFSSFFINLFFVF